MLLSTFAGNTVVALVIALLALAAMRLNRPAAAHVLWLLVIVKLVTPTMVRVEVGTVGATSAVPTVAPAPMVIEDASRVASRLTAPAAPQTRLTTVARAAAVVPRVERSQVSTWHVVAAAWVAGSIAWLVLVAVRVARFRRVLRHGEPADDGLTAAVAAVAERMGLRTPPDVRLIGAAVSPMLWFLGRRPVLVLPHALIASLSRPQREAVIAHELAHLRRRDHWVRLFEIVATAVLWFHPLLWVARRGLREAEEQCCDAWVVALRPDADGRRNYADAIVEALELVSRGGAAVVAPPVVTGLGRITHLHRRVTMILTRVPEQSLSPVGKVVLLAVVVAGLALAPVRGQAPGGTPPAVSDPSAAPAATTRSAEDDETRRAVMALIEAAARDADVSVKNASQAALNQFGARAVPGLLEAMRDPALATIARERLAQLGPDSFSPLLDALDSTEASVRREALTAITQILASHLGVGPMGGPGVPGGYGGAPAGFAPGMEGGGGGFGGLQGAAVVPPDVMTRLASAVSKASRDKDVEVRRVAVNALGALAPHAAMAGQFDALMPSVLAALKDTDVDVRTGAARALIMVPGQAGGALDALIAAVKDENESVRQSALVALTNMGPAAKSATPAVLAAMKDSRPAVRATAAAALGAIQQPPAQPPPAAADPAAVPPNAY
jgi:beta-lactamase regulating signal transducer with metallopeptidase domain/HEAT repeat protein